MKTKAEADARMTGISVKAVSIPQMPLLLPAMFLMVVVFLVSCPLAFAVGISPGSVTLSFKPNETQEFSFSILNHELTGFNISLSKAGELADYISLEETSVDVGSQDFSTLITASIFSSSDLSPGLHQGRIRIVPKPAAGSGAVSALVAPEFLVSIRVPYPEKYAAVQLEVHETKPGDPIPIFLLFDNQGNEDILRAGGAISIFGPDGVLLQNRIASDVNVPKDYLGRSEAFPKVALAAGEYRAVVQAYYDGIKSNSSLDFAIGTQTIVVEQLYDRTIFTGEISKVSLMASNEWNKNTSARGFVALADKKSEMPVVAFRPGEKKVLSWFVDTAGLSPGTYNLTLSFEVLGSGVVSSRTYQVQLLEKPAAGQAFPIGKVKISTIIWTTLAVLIFVTMLVSLILFFRRGAKGARSR
jgi:hypothetical protein